MTAPIGRVCPLAAHLTLSLSGPGTSSIPIDDPAYAHYTEATELPPHVLAEIRRFFQDYKILEKKMSQVDELYDRKRAIEVIAESIAALQLASAAASVASTDVPSRITDDASGQIADPGTRSERRDERRPPGYGSRARVHPESARPRPSSARTDGPRAIR